MDTSSGMFRSYIKNKKARELSDNNTKLIHDMKMQKYHISYGFYHIIDVEDKYEELGNYILKFVKSKYSGLIYDMEQKLIRINSSERILGTRRAVTMIRKTLSLYTNIDNILMNVNINIEPIIKDYINENFCIITDVVNVTKYQYRILGKFGEFLIKAISENINPTRGFIYEIDPTKIHKLYVYNVYMFISYMAVYNINYIRDFASNSICIDSLFNDDEEVKSVILNHRDNIRKAKATLLTIAADEEYSQYFNQYIADLYNHIGVIFIKNIDKVNDYGRFCNLLIEYYNLRPYSEVSVTI